MRKYAGFHHEIRFKIPDYHFQMLQDMTMYIYEAKVIDKPNLHSFGRFCIMQVTNAHIVLDVSMEICTRSSSTTTNVMTTIAAAI
jgi:hypothetical protein